MLQIDYKGKPWVFKKECFNNFSSRTGLTGIRASKILNLIFNECEQKRIRVERDYVIIEAEKYHELVDKVILKAIEFIKENGSGSETVPENSS